MICHHRAAVEMARAIVARSDIPAVKRLAQAIVELQSAEIATMRSILVKKAQVTT
jgi:uncharacterized protein (DUF305 family)